MTTSPTATSRKGRSRPGSTAEHQALVAAILIRFGARPDLRLWKNATGVAASLDGERLMRFGLRGSADILGIMAPTGLLVAIEVKTGAAKQSECQRRFAEMVRKFGGIYIIARTLGDVEKAFLLERPT